MLPTNHGRPLHTPWSPQHRAAAGPQQNRVGVGISELFFDRSAQRRSQPQWKQSLWVDPVQHYTEALTGSFARAGSKITPRTGQHLDRYNRRRGRRSKPSLSESDVLAMRRDIGKIMSSGQPWKMKKKAIGRLRKQKGWTQRETRMLATKPIADELRDSKNHMKSTAKAHDRQLRTAIRDSSRTFGRRSAQTRSLRAYRKRNREKYDAGIKILGTTSKNINSVYKPKSFGEVVGGFFKGIGKAVTVLTAPLQKLPLIGGTFKSMAKSFSSLMEGDFGGFALNGIGAAAGLASGGVGASLVPGVGDIASAALKPTALGAGARRHELSRQIEKNTGYSRQDQETIVAHQAMFLRP